MTKMLLPLGTTFSKAKMKMNARRFYDERTRRVNPSRMRHCADEKEAGD